MLKEPKAEAFGIFKHSDIIKNSPSTSDSFWNVSVLCIKQWFSNLLCHAPPLEEGKSSCSPTLTK